MTPPATDVAREIHVRFLRKMAAGGEIDKILNGGVDAPKIPPAPDSEIELRKRQIDVQMAEYEQAINEAVTWYRGWKDRQPKGFRATRRAKR